jgi:hypothetical protein
MKLDNSSDNKIKLLYKISEIVWFIEKHVEADAENAGDKECQETLNSLHKDLQKVSC